MPSANIGFALTGSFCTFRKVLPVMQDLKNKGYEIIPIMSYNAYKLDTRFGKAEEFRQQIKNITGKNIIATLSEAEPIGPKKLLDVLVISPCTGNTLAKLALGIADTPVTMAAKSHLRNQRPVLIAISSNDALANAAKNIALLQNTKNIFFVPYKQDDPVEKPNSLIADFSMIEIAVQNALNGKQLQPMLL